MVKSLVHSRVVASREESLGGQKSGAFHNAAGLPSFVTIMNDQYSDPRNRDRRVFLKTSATVLGAAGLAAFAPVSSDAADKRHSAPARRLIARNDVVLLQGDSITDMGRSRQTEAMSNDQSALGPGYAWLAAAALLTNRPEDQLKFFNRGISGNKVFQLADRWQADCLDLKPNVLSILIGVNDYWHTLTNNYQGTVEIYERDYRALLERTLKALPKVKIVVCEPFSMRLGSIDEKWCSGFAPYRAAARRVAESCHATFIPFQAVFDEAVKYAPAQYWSNDGVHPSPTGAALMACTWLKTVNAGG
jgi:lysophospholipase L1-like esterase